MSFCHEDVLTSVLLVSDQFEEAVSFDKDKVSAVLSSSSEQLDHEIVPAAAIAERRENDYVIHSKLDDNKAVVVNLSISPTKLAKTLMRISQLNQTP